MLENMIDLSQVAVVKKMLDCAGRVVVMAHKNPDGDAAGSSLALCNYIMGLGKEVTVVLPNAFPEFLSWLPSAGSVLFYDVEADKATEKIAAADILFCLDFNVISRLGDMSVAVSASKATKVLVDHHPFPSNEFDVSFSHPEACSTSELVYRLITALSGDECVTHDIAQCIYTGMMTDTGAFTYASMRKDIYIIIAALLNKGIDKDKIYRKVFFNYTVSRMKLMGYAMYRKLKLYNKYNTALITLSHEELMRFFAVKGDTEGLVNQPLQIKGVRFSCFFREEQPGKINVSLRSVDDFPCNEVAAEFFNGGGHKNASGGELHCSMDEAVRLLQRAIQKFKSELTM